MLVLALNYLSNTGRKILLFFAISFICNPVLAADLKVGDVMYCNSEIFYGALPSDADIKRFKAENFRVNVSKDTIVFGSSGYFSDTNMQIKELQSWRLIAQDEYSTFSLNAYAENTSFTYASANPFAMAVIRGTCDKF